MSRKSRREHRGEERAEWSQEQQTSPAIPGAGRAARAPVGTGVYEMTAGWNTEALENPAEHVSIPAWTCQASLC